MPPDPNEPPHIDPRPAAYPADPPQTAGTPPQAVPQVMPPPAPAMAVPVVPVAPAPAGKIDPHKVAAWVSFLLSLALAIKYIVGQPAPTVPPVIPDVPQHVTPVNAPPAGHPTGWVDDPTAVKVVREGLPEAERYFGDTPAGKAVHGNDGTVLLSDAAKKVFGAHLPARNQGQVGCCVSFGTGTAIEYLQLNQIAHGDPLEFRTVCNEAIYGGSRKQIGGGQIRGDGSVTAWAGQWVKEYGVIPREKVGQYDLTHYSETRARQWGQSGCPKPLEPEAKKSPVKGIAFARSADEAAKAIRQGYPIAVGSQVGFGNTGPYKRDKDGFLNRSGTWGHCQAVVGVRDDNRKGFLVVNSWGSDWISGPTGPFDIPPGSYWVDWATFDAMTKEGDCIVFSDAVGFPARTLDWFTRKAPDLQQQDLFALAR